MPSKINVQIYIVSLTKGGFSMKWLFSLMVIISLIFGIITNKTAEVSKALIEQCTNAVNLSFSLLGMMCFWSGIMQIASVSNFTKILSKLFRPITKLLFKGLSTTDEALQAITMNMSANFLGLGNAATPLGLTAMQKLQEKNANKKVASNNMITFVVLNTCSIQLIPTTIAVLRQNAGSKNPMEILPAVIITSIITAFCALTSAKICNHIFPQKKV